MDAVKEETEEPSSPTTGPASFNGRLNLASYAFSSKLEIKEETQTSSLRKSTRNSTATTPLLSPTPKRKFTSSTPSSSPRKKAKSPAGYAPPSTYAHLPELQDVLEPNLLCVFIGLNPGIMTATSGHAYAHPSNLFWKLLHSSGLTTRRCRPEEDGDLPRLFRLGNTNIVARPTRNGSELSKAEMDASVQVLEEKIRVFRPEAVCIVGKSIWESIWRVRHGRKIKKEEFSYGWQTDGERMGRVEGNEAWDGARVFVATTTSGLAATMSTAEKEKVWKELGTWVEERRKEKDDGRQEVNSER